jgi:hypothetical protein
VQRHVNRTWQIASVLSMTRPTIDEKHSSAGRCVGRSLRWSEACQLCSVHGLARDRVRTAQPAVASVSGLRLCRHHLTLVLAIAADAGAPFAQNEPRGMR